MSDKVKHGCELGIVDNCGKVALWDLTVLGDAGWYYPKVCNECYLWLSQDESQTDVIYKEVSISED